MRILIISTFFPPLNSIASLRPYSWAKFWSEAGHEVSVLTTQKPSFKKTSLSLKNTGFQVHEIPYLRFLDKFKKDYRPNTTSSNKPQEAFSLKRFLASSFQKLRSKTGIFNACRMPDFTDLWIRPAYKFIAKQGTWDLIVSTSGPYAVHVVAQKLKKQGLGKKWIADFRDSWSDNYIYPGIFPLNHIESWLERKLMQSADLITTVSTPFANDFEKRYPHKEVLTVENGFDLSDRETLPQDSIFPEDGKFRIVHTGSIYSAKRDPSPLFQAIADMHKDPIERQLLEKLEVIFVGEQLGNLPSLIESYQVSEWVKNYGMRKREDALRMQRDAHALLFLPWTDLDFPGVLTGKIFEYLFSGTPIIAVGGRGLEQSQQLILDAKAGKILENAQTIRSYLKEKLNSVRKEPIQPLQAILAQYDRKWLALKLLERVQI
ncbi:glycosyltransferase [Parachlamydia sp. AcF125]|uniref:glycosyltransferase n=1 Tax=Parachlamydia sp. AcF125 TaxID=2795736 RepID=UPI001BC92239|nr:glycosyltransferase [Parachlamydia sp. AcF125]